MIFSMKDLTCFYFKRGFLTSMGDSSAQKSLSQKGVKFRKQRNGLKIAVSTKSEKHQVFKIALSLLSRLFMKH